jgi:metal-responsive CopG/Arc/MetJ family transcriptional regulator
MSTLTVELPEALARELEQSGITTRQAEQLIVQLVQAYLGERQRAQTGGQQYPVVDSTGAAFARRVIANNRELFLELASW